MAKVVVGLLGISVTYAVILLIPIAIYKLSAKSKFSVTVMIRRLKLMRECEKYWQFRLLTDVYEMNSISDLYSRKRNGSRKEVITLSSTYILSSINN